MIVNKFVKSQKDGNNCCESNVLGELRLHAIATMYAKIGLLRVI